MKISSQEKNVIAYVGPFKFPSASASSRRVLGLAFTLIDIRKEVYIGTGQRISQAQAIPSSYPELLHIYSLNELPRSSSTYIS